MKSILTKARYTPLYLWLRARKWFLVPVAILIFFSLVSIASFLPIARFFIMMERIESWTEYVSMESDYSLYATTKAACFRKGDVKSLSRRHPSTEELCRDWVNVVAEMGELPFLPERVDSFWSRQTQVNVVAINWRSQDILLGKCKWGQGDVSRTSRQSQKPLKQPRPPNCAHN